MVLLGPQQAKPDVGAALAEAGVRGQIALVTAGWQEREADDQALIAELGVKAVNLTLHARSEQLFAADKELAQAHKARQARLRNVNDFYRIRLDHAFEAARAISVRHVDPELLAEEVHESVEGLRQLDGDHLERCRATHAAFEEKWRLAERTAVAKHRAEIKKLVDDSEAVVVMGGHVASLLNRMKLFDLTGIARKKRWFAAAAGAMVLTERIYLFHDFPPHGTGIAEALDWGFGLVRDLVVLPDPKHRIRTDDAPGIARFVQRIAPATCAALDEGARVFSENGRVTGASCHRLWPDGEFAVGWTG
ncbi:MAG: hypothetical protein IPI67_27130 [Myxococcales bacterium]|nr:hypothetical protein [Myxococcales bacterium]